LRNLLQNPLEQQIALMAPVVPEAVFVQVGLQVLRAHVVIHAADPALHGVPESFDGLSVNVSRNVDSLAVAKAPMNNTFTTLRLRAGFLGKESTLTRK
jgi:hypothetical protein